ncbi:MAG: exodeoxyribonuclease VII large subunit [Clostridia bacterium]
MNNGYILSVSQLNEYAGSLLTNDALLRDISIRGEISGFKRHSSGHLYFSLKDEGALVRCVMFKQNAWELDIDVRDGMEVVASGYISLYVKDGQYQFYVKSMAEEGEGVLFKRFVMLKTRLEAKGLFDEAHKKPLPLLPKKLGIITSPTGAAVQDVINVARRRFPRMDILVYPVKVQGDGAAEQIAAAIRYMDETNAADVIIVGRGGGSMEDLWAFNEETVAQAIYDCHIPIVSAVGHETDFTVADFTADLRAPTPSAAAELCIPEYDAMLEYVKERQMKLRSTVQIALDTYTERINGLRGSAGFAAARHSVQLQKANADGNRQKLYAAVHTAQVTAYNAYDQLKTRLAALAPMEVLKRGYALVKTDGAYVAGVAQLVVGTQAELIMMDGTAQVTINDISTER